MISVIIVDYKTLNKTLSYIEQCKLSIHYSDKLTFVIIDNNPEHAETLHYLKRELDETGIREESILGYDTYFYSYHKIELVHVIAKENLGYARGNNLGARVAHALFQSDYYIFSNNDMKFQEKINLDVLLDHFIENDTCAVVGPRILGLDGEDQSPRVKKEWFHQLFLNYVDLLLPRGIKITRYITDIASEGVKGVCYWVTGSFMLVDAQKFERVEGFDEFTFLYCEEMILSERLLAAGYTTVFDRRYTILHEHGQTVKKTMSAYNGIRLSFAASLYYYQKYRNLNVIIIQLCKLNFILFSGLFLLKKQITNRIRGNERNYEK